MKYRITARDSWSRPSWVKIDDPAIRFPADRFGEINCIHELTDAEVIDAIMLFGRAEIVEGESDPTLRIMRFHNDYD
jgi:hypothetical protein